MNLGDVICISPSVIRPVHEPRDPELFARIERSMRKSGWLGRPILVIPGNDRTYQALTGSHRLAAALAVKLTTVPALVLPVEVAEKVRASRYFPKVPPLIAQDLFEAGESWVGRFILMDQWIGNRPNPWSKVSLDYLRELGHDDMIEIMSVRKWPCPK